MLFTENVTIETTHTLAAPKTQIIELAKGIITFVSVFFPSGCHGLVHATIHHGNTQIFPSHIGSSLTGDSVPIEWDDYYELYRMPHTLKVRAWGVTCDYDHTITIRIAVLPRKAIVTTAVADAIKQMIAFQSPRRIEVPKGS